MVFCARNWAVTMISSSVAGSADWAWAPCAAAITPVSAAAAISRVLNSLAIVFPQAWPERRSVTGGDVAEATLRTPMHDVEAADERQLSRVRFINRPGRDDSGVGRLAERVRTTDQVVGGAVEPLGAKPKSTMLCRG